MDDFDFTTFKSNLRSLINSRGLTVKDFAAEVNIKAATIHRYLAGDRKPDVSYVIAIASFFNVSIDWLLGINGEQFDVMPKEVQEVASLYQYASNDDRNVVQAVLSKYRR